MKKTALTIALISALLFSIVIGSQFSNLATAQTFSTITIKSDGSIEPTTAPITQSGNVYKLTEDIFGCIIVERFSIIIDGAGYSLQGNGSGRGIQIFNPYNASKISSYDVTVKNIVISRFDEGIDVFGYWGNIISGVVITENEITSNNVGIRLSSYERYSNNQIVANKIHGNKIGISMEMGHTGDDSGNTITLNVIQENDEGMRFLWLGDYYGFKPDPFQMNNRIYRNFFRDNSQNVVNAHIIYDPDCANIWDKDAIGNYWSDYTGTDNDGDGIGDTPYVIDANNIDHFPLMSTLIPEENKPTATPTPTPSPPNFGPTSSPTPSPSIPEFSSLAIPLLFTIIVAAGLIVSTRNAKKPKPCLYLKQTYQKNV